jgi:monofunctional biosynthetic peptidoglycan transglycosylase
MLDQKQDDPPPQPSDAASGASDTSASSTQDTSSETKSGGGMLGRFRAGVMAKEAGPGGPPLWRRILVFFVKWGAIVSVGFLVLSTAAVFLIGWTGPPPTLNMATRAMDGVEVRRTWVALKDVSPNIVRAVIASEDQDFCRHNGFDVEEIQKALDDRERGRRYRGASTISQQTAKNVFLFNGGGWARKGFETWFTVLEEWMWSKPRIMEVYLNVAEWGDGIFGIEQAAQERFGVSAKQLTSRQAALLASVLPNPNKWRIDGSYVNSRATQVQSLMAMVRRDGLDTCVVTRR